MTGSPCFTVTDDKSCLWDQSSLIYTRFFLNVGNAMQLSEGSATGNDSDGPLYRNNQMGCLLSLQVKQL